MSAPSILVVEDELVALTLLRAQLVSKGYRVITAQTVPEAISLTRSHTPDLMLLDLTIIDPDPFSKITDGLVFLSMVRRANVEARFPTIIYSASSSPELYARSQEQSLGVFAVIQKGCPFPELLEAVQKALEHGPYTNLATTVNAPAQQIFSLKMASTPQHPGLPPIPLTGLKMQDPP